MAYYTKEFSVNGSYQIVGETSPIALTGTSGGIPSVAVSSTGQVMVAWSGIVGSTPYVFVAERNTSGQWQSNVQFSHLSHVPSKPSVGFDEVSNKVIVLFQCSSHVGELVREKNGSTWTPVADLGTGSSPTTQMSAYDGGAIPLAMWTTESSAPYKINLSPAAQSVSGTITSNTTWSGYYNVVGNVTVNSGATLTVSPGSVVAFSSGTSLFSYGSLLANGTSSSKVTFTTASGTGSYGSWGSIVLDGNGASGSSLDNVIMKYGTEIRPNNVPSFSVTNSTIESTINGINAWGSRGTVSNNSFSFQRDHGIIVSNSTIGTQYNTITKSDNSGAALLYNENSNGWGNYVFHNDIYGYNWGVASSYGASIHFGDQYAGYHSVNNRIRNCLYGLMVYSYAQIDLCDNYNGYMNSIRNNIYYHAYVYSNAQVYAAFNYWYPYSTGLFYVGSGSYLDNGDELGNDPWPDGSGGSRIADVGFQASSDQNGVAQATPQNPLSTQPWIKEGRRLRRQGNLSGAFDCFKNALSNNESPTEALLGIASLHGSNLDKDVEGMLSSLPKNTYPLSA
ncbi:MAG: hypothetical protein WBD36_10315 [Bacteroidota bacterium]